MHETTTVADINRIALKWMTTRDAISAELNSALTIDYNSNRERRFQKRFVEAHNDITRELIAALGIIDPMLMTALGELMANAPRFLYQTPGKSGPN